MRRKACIFVVVVGVAAALQGCANACMDLQETYDACFGPNKYKLPAFSGEGADAQCKLWNDQFVAAVAANPKICPNGELPLLPTAVPNLPDAGGAGDGFFGGGGQSLSSSKK
ncbi:MAG: hypothetical protein GMKNLPBB_00926 [Myxococcota bacterium]|nr:hypothetical protein [Myxococcota bacterium]